MQVIKSNMYNSPPSPYHEEYNCKVSLLLKERRGRVEGGRERQTHTHRDRDRECATETERDRECDTETERDREILPVLS